MSSPSALFSDEEEDQWEDASIKLQRDKEIDRLRRKLVTDLDNVDVTSRQLRQVWDMLHDQWWIAASRIHRQGVHHSRRHHILDFPAFIVETFGPDRIITHMRAIFGADFTAAKAKAEGPARMRNAVNALDLSDPILLFLYLSPAICCSTNSPRLISGLKKSKTHSPVEMDDILRVIRETMIARHLLQPSSESSAPVPTISDISEAVDRLRKSAAPRSPKPSRKRAAAADDDDDEANSGSRRSSKRARLSLAEEDLPEDGRTAYDEEFSGLEPSFLSRVINSIQEDYSVAAAAAPEEPQEEDAEVSAAAADDLLQRQLVACAFLVNSGVPKPVRSSTAASALESTIAAART
ncbi:hypothetical protein CKAH01_13796 [Colletotrichum kahawae]|uniref:Uncharacterized protein n=1 Tax=Colletotrichum kahawae TaxID=34407 RepID=A0AAE0D9H2_COLKA|nr:hypothetical protein CKAH01_13796 [Colletotrichum kahawae]